MSKYAGKLCLAICSRRTCRNFHAVYLLDKWMEVHVLTTRINLLLKPDLLLFQVFLAIVHVVFIFASIKCVSSQE